jgi:ribosomal protein S18 acetylase RimI-like enzyme
MRLKPLMDGGEAFKPFSASDAFTDAWWDEALYGDEPGQHFYAFFDGQHEAARAEVEVQDALNPEYEHPGRPGPYAVINFFEVVGDHHRRGYGTEAVRLLAGRYEGTPLVAYSVGADAFWGALGWEWHRYTGESSEDWSMFISRP